MEFLLIYLYTVAASLASAMIFILYVMGATGVVLAVALCLCLLDPENPDSQSFLEACKQHWKAPFWIGVAMILFVAAIPDKQDLAWIVGGGVTWKIVQSEEVQKLPENTAKAVNHFLESVYGKQEIER